MDLKRELLKAHSVKQTRNIVDYVGDSPGRFKELIAVFLAGPYRVTQRAAWPMSYCVEAHSHLINPHFNVVLSMLTKTGVHDAVKRNVLRLLQFVEIPKRYQGKVVQHCFNFLNDPKEPIAVRVFAMSVLANIAKHEPDLKKELRIIIEDQLPYGSPAYVSRARKVLKSL